MLGVNLTPDMSLALMKRQVRTMLTDGSPLWSHL